MHWTQSPICSGNWNKILWTKLQLIASQPLNRAIMRKKAVYTFINITLNKVTRQAVCCRKHTDWVLCDITKEKSEILNFIYNIKRETNHSLSAGWLWWSKSKSINNMSSGHIWVGVDWCHRICEVCLSPGSPRFAVGSCQLWLKETHCMSFPSSIISVHYVKVHESKVAATKVHRWRVAINIYSKSPVKLLCN